MQGLRSTAKATDRTINDKMIFVLVLAVALLSARAAIASHCAGGLLIGGGGDDTIRGSSCDDVIVGNDGDNILTGFQGHDLFAFSTGSCRGLEWQAGWIQLVVPSSADCFVSPFPFFGSFGVSQITDFTRGFDRIGLDKATFTALQSEIALGLSDPTDFRVVDSDALVDTAPAVIVYSIQSEMLFYNENGPAAGLGQGGPFVELPGVALLAPSDFQVLDWTPTVTTTTIIGPGGTTTTALPRMTTTTTLAPPVPECLRAEDCDDSNPCTDDGCAAGYCDHADNATPCDDGDVCTAGDFCGGGVCVPGVPLDADIVASFVNVVSETPASCDERKDKRRARKIAKDMKAARKKLEKAGAATKERKRQKHIERAEAKLCKARALTDKLAGKLSRACHAEILELVTKAQAQAGCLP